jgi:general secretion pathway protein K
MPINHKDKRSLAVAALNPGFRAVRVNKRSRNGSALLMVLWLTAALSAVGLAVANHVRAETERTETNVDDARSYFVARGAIEQAALHIIWGQEYRADDGSPLYYVNGNPSMDLTFPAADVHVDVIPETSKLNLNYSRPEDVLRLLLALGTTEEQATEITAAIVDWRTRVDQEHPSPFDSFYLSQSPSFTARHASFQENEELLLVKGMTAELYYGSSLDNRRAGVRDCVSVYGSAGGVDINTAQQATLQAVGLSPADADTIVRSRAQHPVLNYKELADIQQSLGPAGNRLQIGGRTMFTLRATARLRQPDGKLSDLRRTVGALVKFYFPGNAKNIPAGFEVVRWFDRV